MSKFILLNDAANNASTVIINADTIQYVEEDADYTGASYVCADDCEFHVTQTREQIFEMLK